MKLVFELQKKISKEDKEYYVLYNEDIEKTIFLTKQDIKLLKLLNPEKGE